MRRNIFVRCAGLITAVALVVSVFGMQTGATISDEKDKLNKLEESKKNVQKTLDSLKKDKQSIEEKIRTLDAELSEISVQLYQTEQDLKSVEKKIKKNEKKLVAAQESIEEQYGSMKLRIQFMYENGNQEIINMILSSQSISDFLNKAEYISELSTYDRKMLDKMKETKQEIETTQATLEDQRNTLTVLKTEQEQHKASVEILVEAKQQEMAAFDAQIAANNQALDELDSAIGSQQDIIDEMKRIEEERKKEEERRAAEEESKRIADQQSKKTNTKPSTTPSSGIGLNGITSGNVSVAGYIWPLPGYSAISSGFGYRSDPFTGQAAYHSGIDIPAPSGTSIVAAASGEVAWANYSSTAGNWIGIDHGNGVYTVYMHMSALLVSAGQTVSQGQTIGLVGTTGSSTGNHLHFSVRLNGAYVSPLSYVSP